MFTISYNKNTLLGHLFGSESLSHIAPGIDAFPQEQLLYNKMNLHNQFANLDYRKTPIEADLPPKLKRARSLSTKILKHSPLLPRLDSRASSRHKSRRQEHAEHGRKPSRAEGDYKAYLQYPHYVQRPNQLATMPTTLVSSFSKVIISPLGCIPEYPTISISHRPDKSARQQLQRQKQKSPIKYKILAELGYTDEAIVQMTEAEQRQLQDEYLRNKGKEYLRESRLRIKIDHICHPREEEKEQKRLPSYSPNRDKNYVREIFKEVSQAARIREQARELVRREKLHEEMKLKRLKQCEDALGNYVYRRVAKHLRASHKQKLNFFQQVKGEAKVDEALINFIKFKIKRIHTTLQ